MNAVWRENKKIIFSDRIKHHYFNNAYKMHVERWGWISDLKGHDVQTLIQRDIWELKKMQSRVRVVRRKELRSETKFCWSDSVWELCIAVTIRLQGEWYTCTCRAAALQPLCFLTHRRTLLALVVTLPLQVASKGQKHLLTQACSSSPVWNQYKNKYFYCAWVRLARFSSL